MKSKPSTPRTLRVRRGASIALAALAGAATLSACGSSSSSSSSSSSTPSKTNLNIARVEQSIKQNIKTQRNLTATVVCPAVVPQEKGKVFECTATTPGLKAPHAPVKTQFVVTVQNASGYVTFVGK
jgi:hypothetical protein